MDDERVSLLANEQDVHLLREIAKWRRGNCVSYFQWRPGVGFGAFTEWYRYADRKRSTVSYEPADRAILVTRNYYNGEQFRKLPSGTVTETVDMLVALGFLPPRFSSAYRSGWEARHHAQTVACQDSMTEPGWNSPEVLALAPAVEAAW